MTQHTLNAYGRRPPNRATTHRRKPRPEAPILVSPPPSSETKCEPWPASNESLHFARAKFGPRHPKPHASHGSLQTKTGCHCCQGGRRTAKMSSVQKELPTYSSYGRVPSEKCEHKTLIYCEASSVYKKLSPSGYYKSSEEV